MHFTRYAFLAAMLCTTVLAAADAGQPEVSNFDLMEVFRGSPIIYSLLLVMSVSSAVLWCYSMLTLRESEVMPKDFTNRVRELLSAKHFDAALSACQEERSFAASIIASGIAARKHGPQMMMEALEAEGRRRGNTLWQRISLLNEIAVIAPMLGLLGTVTGLFFAFYGMERSAESLSAIFDGFGMAVGTTVAGLIVSIAAMIFYTSLRFRVVGLLNSVENEALSMVSLVESEWPATRGHS